MLGFTILQVAAAALFSLPFNDGPVPGVDGQAEFFDGFDSRVVVKAEELPVPTTHFTVDMWACPIAFPKSPCPLACRQRNDVPGGWTLWLDAWGKVHFQVANGDEWLEVVSPESIQLRQWSRVTAMFRGSNGLYLAIDGKQVAKLDSDLPAVNQKEYDLWIGRTPVRVPSFMENKGLPIYSSFDGAIDELKIYPNRTEYPKILKEKFMRPAAPGTDVAGFEERRLPSGPDKLAFGGYIKDSGVRDKSTSGGAFSAIATAFCDENYAVFGAESKGLSVYHSHITDISQLDRFRKSKYSQSVMGAAYKDCKRLLDEGKKVLFSGTPCQIAGLKAYLMNREYSNLLTVEVICEGVPSPLYMEKYDALMSKKYGSKIEMLDYRYTDSNSSKKKGKWDFQVMYTQLENGKSFKKDRWFNSFWSVWLNHLMSRPSCYSCLFTNTARVADISLGDLWGVHLYCPELYGKNMGSSLVVCNTEKGKVALNMARDLMYGHELDFNTALKYQSPMRKSISVNPDRDAFIEDLKNDSLDFKEINKKWAKKPTFKLLWQKYAWGNRQKIAFWNLTHSKGSKSND
jgi:coenzyme F420-reducing hydrogenase beta subunit